MNNSNCCQLFCQNIGHEDSQILGVCLYQECQQRRAWCVGCKFQLHGNHQQELKTFDELQNWIKQNNNNDKLKELLSQAQSMVKLITQFIQTKEEAYQKFNFYQMKFTDLKNSVNQLIRVNESQREVIEFLQPKFSPDNIKKLQDLIQPNSEFAFRRGQSVTQLSLPDNLISKPLPLDVKFNLITQSIRAIPPSPLDVQFNQTNYKQQQQNIQESPIQQKGFTQITQNTRQQNEPKKNDVPSVITNLSQRSPNQQQYISEGIPIQFFFFNQQNNNIEKEIQKYSQNTSSSVQRNFSQYDSKNQQCQKMNNIEKKNDPVIQKYSRNSSLSFQRSISPFYNKNQQCYNMQNNEKKNDPVYLNYQKNFLSSAQRSISPIPQRKEKI